MYAVLGVNFFEKGAFRLLAPPKKMSFLIISSENTRFISKTQRTRSYVIVAPNKGQE